MKLHEIAVPKDEEPEDESVGITDRRQAGDVIHPRTTKNLMKKLRRKGELPMFLKKQAD